MGALNQTPDLEQLQQRVDSLEQELRSTRRALERARKDREHYRRLVDHAADGLVVHDREGRFLEVNPRAADILGYSVEELLCLGLGDVEPDFNQFGIQERLESLEPGAVLTVEGRPRRGDGLPVVVEVRTSLLEQLPTGRSYIAFLRDITDRKETVRDLSESSERFRRMLEEYQAHLVQVERLATFGTLGAAVGHELNNLGQIFLGAADLLTLERSSSPRMETIISELKRATEQLAHHARHLLAAARPSSDADEAIDLGQQITDTVTLLRRAGKLKRTRITIDVPQGTTCVQLNRSRLEQVLINLLTNAAEALLEGSGSASIHVEQTGARVVLRVVDEGAGISDEDLPRIFDPYFTTKRHHVGLGLLVVRQIAREYGGEARVSSEVNRGTEVAIDFPLADSKDSGVIPAGRLLVDDPAP